MGTAKRNCIAIYTSFLLAASVLPAMAGETYYRWIDKDGTPMNSDHPPPTGIEYEKVIVGSGLYHRPYEGETAPSLAEESDPLGGAAEEHASTAGQHESTKDSEACETARRNLETLNTRARIRMPDGSGSYYFLTEGQKKTQREQANAVITRVCE